MYTYIESNMYIGFFNTLDSTDPTATAVNEYIPVTKDIVYQH